MDTSDGITRRHLLVGVGLGAGVGAGVLSPARLEGSPDVDGSVPEGEWSVPGRDPARTKRAADATPPEGDAEVEWEASLRASFERVTVAVGNDTVYVPGFESVAAVDIRSGRRRWLLDTTEALDPEGVEIHGGLMLSEGRVMFTSPRGLHAVDSETGEAVWTRGYRGDLGMTVLAGDALYMPGEGASVVVVDPRTGGLWDRWSIDETRRPLLLTEDALVCVGEGSVAAFDAVSGERLWRKGSLHVHHVGSRREGVATGGRIVVGSNPMVALNAGDGSEEWRYEVPTGEDGYETFEPATDGKRVFVSSYERGESLALDLETGERVWRADEYLGSPVVADGSVYWFGEGGIRIHSADDGERVGVIRDALLGSASDSDGVGALSVAGDRLYAVLSPTERRGERPTPILALGGTGR